MQPLALKFIGAGLAVTVALALGQSQTPAPAQRTAGTVTAVNPQTNQVSLKTDKGELTVTTTERTQILHAQPGEADPNGSPARS